MAATAPSTPFLSLDFTFSPLLADTPTQTPFLRELQALLGEDAEAQLARKDSLTSRARSSIRLLASTPSHPLSTSSAQQYPTSSPGGALYSHSGAPSPLSARKRSPHTLPSAVPELLVTDVDAKALPAVPLSGSSDSVTAPLSSNSSSLARHSPSLQVPALRRSTPSSGSRRSKKRPAPPTYLYATPKEIIALLTLLEDVDNEVEEDVARIRENIKEVREALDEVRETRKAKQAARAAKIAAGKENVPPKVTLTAVSSDFWLS
ncbi:hypothetical protein EV714DRAFT_243869 [Schizophyllum commune]